MWKIWRRHIDLFIIGLYLIPLVFFTFLFILPLSSLFLAAFFYGGKISMYWFTSIFTDTFFINFQPRTGYMFNVYGDTMYIWGLDYGVILNTIIVALMTTLFSSILGLVTAFILARYDFPGKNLFRILLYVPMLATPFVNAYVLGKLFHPTSGLINFIFYDLLHLFPYRIDLNGLVGISLAQILSYFPIVYLNVQASLINIDPNLEEQAENLGAKGFSLFRRITFPLALPGLTAGMIITFIFSMEDLSAPIGFIGYSGNPLAKKVMSYYIFQSFSEAMRGVITPETAALSLILLSFSIFGFIMIKRYVSLKTYASISRGGRWNPRVKRIYGLRLFVVYVFLISIAIFASLPQIGTILLAITDWIISGILPKNITLEYFYSLLHPSVSRSISNSLIYSSIAVLIAVFIGSSSSYSVARFKGIIPSILDILSTIPVAIPGIVLAVGYFMFFTTFFRWTFLDPLLDPAPLLILAYSFRRLPFAARSIFAGLQQVHVALEEAAMNLGASRFKSFFKIVLPLILMNLFSGAILTFVYCMSESSTSVTLGALRWDRGPITFYIILVVYGSILVGSASVGASLCVLLMSIQILDITISNYILKQRVAIYGF
ncbi:MAG: iron ABC transporter permease [Candidatus Methanomethylicia archaeon]